MIHILFMSIIINKFYLTLLQTHIKKTLTKKLTAVPRVLPSEELQRERWFLNNSDDQLVSNMAISRTKHQIRSEEHTSELQSRPHLVCRLLLEKKKRIYRRYQTL